MEIRYRSWCKGEPPKPIKLEIPGWAGEVTYSTSQPWHCKPFVDASTYGLELTYPFDTEVIVKMENDKLVFDCDFTKEKEDLNVKEWDIPFSKFAENHFGFTSSIGLKTPENIGTMILPHPRFFTDRTGTVPLPTSGFIRTDFWNRIFFVVFKSPLEGQKYIFRKGEPYAHLIFLPKKTKYNVSKMSPEQISEAEDQENCLNQNSKKIATKIWKTDSGDQFDNKYKIMEKIFSQGGEKAILELMENSKINPKKMKRKLFFKND
jgi:hypothetical protein